MTLDRRMRRRLRQEADRLTEASARHLIEGRNAETANAARERAELARALLSQSSHSSTQIHVSAVVAFLCLLLASLMWTVRVPATDVVIKLVADGVALRLSKPLSANLKVTARSVSLNNIETVHAPELGLVTAEPDEMKSSGAALTLDRIDVPAGAGLELERQGGGLTLYVKDGGLDAHLEIQRGELRLKRNGRLTQTIPVAADIPETFELTSKRRTADPVKLVVDGAGAWRLPGIRATSIEACKEDPPDSGDCRSTVINGTVSLPATGKTVQIFNGDQLIAEGLETVRLELVSDKNGLTLAFWGRADEIRVGADGFEQNLAPTWLEYLYHQEQLAVFWSAVLFLWGILWSLRSLW